MNPDEIVMRKVRREGSHSRAGDGGRDLVELYAVLAEKDTAVIGWVGARDLPWWGMNAMMVPRAAKSAEVLVSPVGATREDAHEP